jgi:hypothetical protein
MLLKNSLFLPLQQNSLIGTSTGAFMASYVTDAVMCRCVKWKMLEANIAAKT